MTVLHATEPASVYLSLLARVEGLRVADVDRALYDDRTLVKQVAMRRTQFLFPRDLLPAAWGSASARVADALGNRLAKEAVEAGLAADGAAWLEEARAATLAHLTHAPDKPYGAHRADRPRVLTQLGVEGRITRAHSTGHWRIPRNTWALTESWLGDVPAPWAAPEGYAELVRRWRSASTEAAPAGCCPTTSTRSPRPSPGRRCCRSSTPRSWGGRGAASTSERTLERVPSEARRGLDAEAARLTEWLDGQRVSTVYPSPAMKEAR